MLRPITRHVLNAPTALRFPQARMLTIATASPTFSAVPEAAATDIHTALMNDIKRQTKESAKIREELANSNAADQAANAAYRERLQEKVTELTSELSQLKRFQARHESNLNNLGFVRIHMMRVKAEQEREAAEQEREAAERQMEKEKEERKRKDWDTRMEGVYISMLHMCVGVMFYDVYRWKSEQVDEGADNKAAQ